MALGITYWPKVARMLEWKFMGHGISTLAAYFLLGFVSALLFVIVILQSGQRLRKAINKKTRLIHLATGYTNLSSLKSRSAGSSTAREQISMTRDDDDEILSDYDVISSRTLSRQDSQESIEDDEQRAEKSTKSYSWGVNRSVSGDADLFGSQGFSVCGGRQPALCSFSFSLLCDQSDVILRLIESRGGRCGRLRVNPVSSWYSKWTVQQVALRTGGSGEGEGEGEGDDCEEGLKRGDMHSCYDVTDGSVPSVFRSNQYQDAAGVAMNEEFRFVPKVMPKQLHISCRVLETSRVGGVTWGGTGQGESECALLGSGHTIVNAASLRSGGTLTMNIFAQPEVSESSILISLNYLPLAERLCVVIMKVKDLKLRDGDQTPQSVYVKVELYRREQRLKKKKTSTKHNTCNPVFNDMLGFDLMRQDLNQAKLKVLVVQRLKQPGTPQPHPPLDDQPYPLLNNIHSHKSTNNKKGVHDDVRSDVTGDSGGKTYDYYVFGMCSFGGRKCSPSEKDHFDQMLKSPRVPVAKWHLLKMTTF